MKIYNTLTRQKEEFVPLQAGKVGMYVCGPTVYNYIHIGNARPMIVFDTVRRYLQYKGFDVNYVSNYTDVDDRIIKKSIEEGISALEVANKYIEEVKKDAKALNVLDATTHPRATEEIDGMLSLIQTLIDKGYAYEKNGTVYFRTRKFSEYGKLSNKNVDELEGGHREIKVAGEEDKEDSLDFVLWKPKKEGEPYWEAEWSKGRPGWHIECSVMAKKYIGDEIDIHAGGIDLVFPHHENEIAQSEAANGTQFAKYWMHNAFLNINNKKMSKSEGNFFTVREISEKYSLDVLRFFMLSAHYRSPINFSDELMKSAEVGLERIRTAVKSLKERISKASTEITLAEEQITVQIKDFVTKFENAMEDDFNTADAIAVIFEMVKLANQMNEQPYSKEILSAMLQTILKLGDILGLVIEVKEELPDSEIEAMIEDRQNARRNKDFKLADEIRNKLLDRGIILEDTREGVRFKRV